MRELIVIFIIKLVLCENIYYFDVNKLHEPLTLYDKAEKTVKYCIYMNNVTLVTNYLLGTWYSVYQFSPEVNAASGGYCRTTNFTTPTKEELDEYKAKYNLENETFTFDDGPVLCSQSRGRHTGLGLVVGNKTAKYYFLEPKTRARLTGMYEVMAYKPVDNDYLIQYACNMRGHTKYLWSRRKNQTESELADVLKPLYEVAGMRKQPLCIKKEVTSTTPYF